MCDLLTVMDAKIVQVSLSGLENILRTGEQEAKQSPVGSGNNVYANLIEECYGLDKIEFLQSHENMDIYQKAFDIIEHYFGSEDDNDSKVAAPTIEENQFHFQPQKPPSEHDGGAGGDTGFFF